MSGFLNAAISNTYVNSYGDSVFSGNIVLDDGKIGIGIGAGNSPSRALVVNFTDDEGIRLDNTHSGGSSAINFRRSYGTPDINWCAGVIGSDDSFRISNDSYLGSSDKLVIKTSGNVGVGSASPSRKLHISFTDNEGLLLDNTWNGGGSSIIYRTSYGTDVNWCSGIYGSDSSFRISKNGSHGTNDYFIIDSSGNVELSGNLKVKGTTTTIESTTVTVDDKNIELGSVDTPTDTTADGGGITLLGSTNKTILWTNSTDKWHFNQGIDITGDINLSGSLSFDGSGATANQILDQDDLSSNSATALATQQSIKAYVDAQIEVQSGWTDSGSSVYLTTSTDKVGIGTSSPTAALEIDGDIKLTPTAISTAHITTAGSMRIRAESNLHIGDNGADSVRIGRTNTTAAKIHIRSGADTDLVVSNSKVGIGTDSPDAALHVAGAAAFSGPSETFVTFGSSDTTPSVATGNLFKTHASAQTITDFDDGVAGQTITVISTAAVVFDVTSSGLKGGSTNITTASGDMTVWSYDGTDWYLVQFMDVSADHSSVGGGTVTGSSLTDNTLVVGAGSSAISIPDAAISSGGYALTVNSASGLTLGAGGDEFTITESSDNITISNTKTDKDIIFKTSDGSAKTLMTLDGSANAVKFNQNTGIYVGDGGELRLYAESGGNTHVAGLSSNHDIIFSTYPSASATEALRLDGGNSDGRVSVGGVASALATLDVNGSVRVKHVNKTSDYTIDSGSGNGTNDYIVGVNTSGGTVTITLPAAATAGAGRIVVVKDEGGAAATNNITIDGNGSETIDGATTITISGNRNSVTLYCDGSNWHIM